MHVVPRILPILFLILTFARMAFAASNYETAVAKALDGDLRAALAVGQMLLDGTDGAAKDPIAAARWFRRCADAGNPQAQNQLGYMYAEGIGVPVDGAEAMRWFLRAAVAGYPPAQFDLGHLYADGKFVSADPEEAVRWYRRAANAGFAPAEFNLAMTYLEGSGVPSDLDQAVFWLTRAAQDGNHKAQMNLALLYAAGRPGLPQDPAAALKWMRASAEAHYICAEYNLALLYRTSAEPHAAEAAQWFARATHHVDGFGQPVDLLEACEVQPPPPGDKLTEDRPLAETPD